MALSLKRALSNPNSLKSLNLCRQSVASIHCTRSLGSTEKASDTPIHTGQQWEADDLRMVRFEMTPKQVNPRWAIDLIKEVPPIPKQERVAVCEGGPAEALGHPKIFINLDDTDASSPKSCIYCGLRFYREHHH